MRRRQFVTVAGLRRPGRRGTPSLGDNQFNELVAAARQTDAEVRFIEDPDLLRQVGGVAALLRFRLGAPAETVAVRA